MQHKCINYDNYLEQLFNNIGFNMPSIAFIISFFYLYYKKHNLLQFLTLFFISILFNTSLKLYFKEQRPLNNDFYSPLPGHEYGMPSGHAQIVSFTLFYLYFLFPNNNFILLLAIFCIALTSTQRVYDKRHTKKQVYAGISTGIISAFIVSNIDIKY